MTDVERETRRSDLLLATGLAGLMLNKHETVTYCRWSAILQAGLDNVCLAAASSSTCCRFLFAASMCHGHQRKFREERVHG
jgi:hypothetical protein